MGIVWLTNCFLYFFQEKGHANIDKISLWGENMAKKDKNKGEKRLYEKPKKLHTIANLNGLIALL